MSIIKHINKAPCVSNKDEDLLESRLLYGEYMDAYKELVASLDHAVAYDNILTPIRKVSIENNQDIDIVLLNNTLLNDLQNLDTSITLEANIVFKAISGLIKTVRNVVVRVTTFTNKAKAVNDTIVSILEKLISSSKDIDERMKLLVDNKKLSKKPLFIKDSSLQIDKFFGSLFPKAKNRNTFNSRDVIKEFDNWIEWEIKNLEALKKFTIDVSKVASFVDTNTDNDKVFISLLEDVVNAFRRNKGYGESHTVTRNTKRVVRVELINKSEFNVRVVEYPKIPESLRLEILNTEELTKVTSRLKDLYSKYFKLFNETEKLSKEATRSLDKLEKDMSNKEGEEGGDNSVKHLRSLITSLRLYITVIKDVDEVFILYIKYLNLSLSINKKEYNLKSKPL